MSIKHETDIATLAVNAEYVNPYSLSFDRINRLTKKIGIPFLPISPITILVLLQPWTFYLSFPAKMTYVMGRRHKPYELTNGKSYAELSDDEIKAVRDKLHTLMQEDLNQAVKSWQTPLQHGRVLPRRVEKPSLLPLLLPLHVALPLYRVRTPSKTTVKDGSGIDIRIGWFTWLLWLVRNPIIIAYYIPILGWIPLAIKGYRKNKLK